jgi:hypothetical protein
MSLRLGEPTDVSVLRDANTGQAETEGHNLEELTQVQDQAQGQQEEVQVPDRVAKAVSAFCLVD